MTFSELVLAALFLVAATLYSSVGHAGASGYLAAMALFGVAADTMKPTALVLNVLVATIASVRFWRAGHFDWRLAWPFVLGAAPLAFVGGGLMLPGRVYRAAIGAILVLAAWQMLRSARRTVAEPARARAPALPALLVGAGIGLLSGLTGTGGGIFLSPIVLLAGWADARHTAALSAVFILVNSLAGLAGAPTLSGHLPAPWTLAAWLLAVGVGGLLGSWLGSRRLGGPALRRLLAVVLLVAAAKLLFG